MIEATYFVKLKKKHENLDPKLQKRVKNITQWFSKINFTICDKFMLLKKKILTILCCHRLAKIEKYESSSEIIYYKGFKKIEQDLSIENIMNT